MSLAVKMILLGSVADSTGGSTPPPPVGLVKTMTLQNTSGSATSTESHTPSFGLMFDKGDITSGSYPILKTTGGTTVPYTCWGLNTWSDGSVKFMACLPRFPDAIPGSTSASLQVYSGGSVPGVSSRTLAEVYAANITVVGTGGLDNISGNWTCNLQAANILETVVYGDGQAGKVWRFLCNFNQAGSPHGQLVTYFYLMALQDGAGNLAGFRVLPRVTQPYYNYDTPAKNFRSFTSLTLQYSSSGGTAIFDPIANSFSPKTFTWPNTGAHPEYITSTAHGYNNGVCGRLTTTGTLPTGLNTGTTYWVIPVNANTLTFCDHPMTAGGTSVVISGTGSGTHTFTPANFVCHFGSAFIATTEAKYVYIQGGGSVASDPTILVQADKAYDRGTHILPPYDLSIGTVTGNTSYNWAPQQTARLTTYIPTSGERGDIGLINAFHARHFYTQAAVDERYARIIGLAQGYLSGCIRDHTTRGPVNLSRSSYTGMPPSIASTWRWYPPAGYQSGFTAPAGGPLYWGAIFNGPSLDHQTQFTGYPYLITGEPQYGDMTLEAANMAIGCNDTSSLDFTVGGTTYYTIMPAGKGAMRVGAWSYRDLIFATLCAPDVPADGTGTTTYLKDIAAANSTYLVAWNNSNNAWWKTNGFWGFQNSAAGRASWQLGYFWSALNLHAWGLEDSNAASLCSSLLKWPPYVKAQSTNLWCLGTYYELNSTLNNNMGPPFSDADGYWGPYNSAANISWTISGNLFTWTTPKHTPANGDRVIFWCLNRPGSNFAFMSTYYAVNTSGNNFQLSATPGGTAIVVQSNFDLNSWAGAAQPVYNNFAAIVIPANPPSTGFVSSDDYGANQRGNINWSIAGGATATGIAACSAELATRLAGYGYTGDPKWAFSSSF